MNRNFSLVTVLFLCILMISSCDQFNSNQGIDAKAGANTFAIHGEVKGLKDHTWIYMNYGNAYLFDTPSADSCLIENGAFSFTDTISSMKRIRLRTKESPYFSAKVYVEPNLDVSITEKPLEDVFMPENRQIYVNIIGNDDQKLLAEYQLMNKIWNAKRELTARIYLEREENVMIAEMYKASMRENDAYQEEIKAFVYAHLDSPMVWEYLETQYQRAQSGSIETLEIRNFIDSMKANAKRYNLHTDLNKGLAQIDCLAVGKEPIDFALYDQHGKLTQLSDFKGKQIVLVFSSSSCMPCEILSQRMQEFVNKVPQDDYQMITVYNDSKPVGEFYLNERKKLPWITLSNRGDDGAYRGDIQQDYSVYSTPHIYLINKDFKVASRSIDFTGVIEHICSEKEIVYKEEEVAKSVEREFLTKLLEERSVEIKAALSKLNSQRAENI